MNFELINNTSSDGCAHCASVRVSIGLLCGILVSLHSLDRKFLAIYDIHHLAFSIRLAWRKLIYG